MSIELNLKQPTVEVAVEGFSAAHKAKLSLFQKTIIKDIVVNRKYHNLPKDKDGVKHIVFALEEETFLEAFDRIQAITKQGATLFILRHDGSVGTIPELKNVDG